MLKTQLDYAQHLFSNIDAEWFPPPTWEDAPIVPQSEQVAPNIKAVMRALAAGWASDKVQHTTRIGYQDQHTYTKTQARIATASGFWLDYVAADFFGSLITRHPQESDFNFRRRLIINLLVDHGTRCAIVCNLTNLTGYVPKIVELMETGDCGAYSVIGQTYQRSTGPNTVQNVPYYPPIAYGTADGSVAGAGAYGSMSYPFQCFVRAYRPLGEGIANVNGYSGMLSGYQTLPPGGFGYVDGRRPLNMGLGQYCALDEISGSVTDQDIYDTVSRSTVAGVIAWTNISDFVEPSPHYSGGMLGINAFLGNFVLVDPMMSPDAMQAQITIGVVALTTFGFQPTLRANITVGMVIPVVNLNVPTSANCVITLPVLLYASFNLDLLYTNLTIPVQLVATMMASNRFSGLITIPLQVRTTVSTQSAWVANITVARVISQAYLVTQPSQITVAVITTVFTVPTVDLVGTFIVGRGVLGVAGGQLAVSWQLGFSVLGKNYGY